MSKHITSILVAVALSCASHGQTQLLPVWSEGWPFGQDEQPVPVPVSADNHVAVDASTGRILLTIDDQLELFSPHFDILFTFDANGNDLSQSPFPLLGSAAAGPNDPSNVESTSDLATYNGVLYHARELNMGFGSGSVGSLISRAATGEGWKLGMGRGSMAAQKGRVLADASGVIAVRNLGSSSADLLALDAAGWLLWFKMAPAQYAVLLGGEIVTLFNGTLSRFDRATGEPIGPGVPIYAGSYAPVMATDGTRIYYAYTDWSTGNCNWGCATLDGTVLWSHTAGLNLALTEMEVDGFGRPWLIGNSMIENTPPLLVITGTDGSAYDLFTYGGSMNDLAMGDGRAYITGQTVAGTNGTYLIAVSTDITTTVERPVIDTSVRLYPQPASNDLRLINATVARGAHVVDITGQIVPTPVLSPSMIDVSKLAEGVYFIQANSASGPITKRFVVAR